MSIVRQNKSIYPVVQIDLFLTNVCVGWPCLRLSNEAHSVRIEMCFYFTLRLNLQFDL